MNKQVIKYLSEIGKKGGKKSRRTLSPEIAKQMVKIREAKKLFQKYYNQCFWSFDPNYKIGANDVLWVADQLMRNGDRKLWEIGNKLCR